MSEYGKHNRKRREKRGYRGKVKEKGLVGTGINDNCGEKGDHTMV